MSTVRPLRLTLTIFRFRDTPTPFSNHHALRHRRRQLEIFRGSRLGLIAYPNHRRDCLSHRLNAGLTCNVLWSKKPEKKTWNVMGCYSQPVLAHYPRLLISSRSNLIQSVHVLWVASPVMRLALTLDDRSVPAFVLGAYLVYRLLQVSSRLEDYVLTYVLPRAVKPEK
jgi:hypothetical protein